MSSKKKVLLLILFLIILDIILYLITAPPKYYNQIELSDVNFIKNETKMKYLDTVVLVGLDKENIKGVSVVVRELTDDIKNVFKAQNNLDLQATIIGNGTQFVMYVSDMGRTECILPVSHELIHLSQYYTGELKILPNKQIEWKGVVLDDSVFLSIPYDEREWEKVAFQMEYKLSDLIKEELY